MILPFSFSLSHLLSQLLYLLSYLVYLQICLNYTSMTRMETPRLKEVNLVKGVRSQPDLQMIQGPTIQNRNSLCYNLFPYLNLLYFYLIVNIEDASAFLTT
jgi:hypothetical protein